MEVLVAEKCGFCHGVRNAISMAEQTLAKEPMVYSLGPIIHNRDVVLRLARAGLRTVESVDEIDSGTVLIRSHGAAPAEIARLREKGLTIVDATCVLVKRVQHIAEELQQQGYKVVIIGDENHPEVKAVVGCAGDVVVVAGVQDLGRLPKAGKLGIVCQTTDSPEHFGEMLAAIVKRGFDELRVINTLCREAMRRQESAVELCKKVDVMFVLGGLESANTRKLAVLCGHFNPHTHHLENWAGVEPHMLAGKGIAGVTAGASTPDWIIEDFVQHLRDFAG